MATYNPHTLENLNSCRIMEFTIKSELNKSLLKHIALHKLKADYFTPMFTDFGHNPSHLVFVIGIRHFRNNKSKFRDARYIQYAISTTIGLTLLNVAYDIPQRKPRMSKRTRHMRFKAPRDPEWSDMWYINPIFSQARQMGIFDVWSKMGLTGKGVTVSIVDDGVEFINKDLSDNYEIEASIDIIDNDTNPSPTYDLQDSNRHGTRCAGVIAAKASNNFCGVGVAYDARIGGIRIIDGPITDGEEARAFSFRPHKIDIYSVSWGPSDNGKTVDGPRRLTMEALKLGTKYGRRGRGSIYIWASGNGGDAHDHCSCDGYVKGIVRIVNIEQ